MGKLTDWKDEAPPPHIEGERPRQPDHHKRDNKPNDGKAPQDEGDNKANYVNDIARVGNFR